VDDFRQDIFLSIARSREVRRIKGSADHGSWYAYRRALTPPLSRLSAFYTNVDDDAIDRARGRKQIPVNWTSHWMNMQQSEIWKKYFKLFRTINARRFVFFVEGYTFDEIAGSWGSREATSSTTISVRWRGCVKSFW
jgi:hypothetical protein